MKERASFRWLFLPLLLLSALAAALYIERTGLSYSARPSKLFFLDPLPQTKLNEEELGLDKDSLVLFDAMGVEGAKVIETVSYTLQSMRVRCDAIDVNGVERINFDQYQTVVLAFTDLDKVQNQILELFDWVEQGGWVLFAIRPDPSQSFTAIYRKVGISSKNDQLVTVEGVHFLQDFLPGAKGMNIGIEFMPHNSIPVQLDVQCNLLVTSADQYQLPLLWVYEFGSGRVVFVNTDQFSNKASRGILAAAYSLLQDVFVYPVINSAMLFIDDFPAPIPEGQHELVTREFGRNLQSFYLNIWWPDMQSFARRYGIKYTGVIIETYDDVVMPPFKPQSNVEMFNYLGSSLLGGGGEIGWHGYNHVPLCLQGLDCDHQHDYPYWPSEENMRESLEELVDFGHALFGDQPFNTYVPPSNILSSHSRAWLPEALQGLKVISSVYLGSEEEYGTYVQEFEEASDGIIELPRIGAGFLINEYMQWAAINEMSMHYVISHFVHPDDILDVERSGGYGWSFLRNQFDDYLMWLYRSAPGIRNMTAREGAMAVQRYARLGVESKIDQGNYHIMLHNFYDEAYLLMRTAFKPVKMEGGEFSKVADGLFLIHATQPDVILSVEGYTIPVSGQKKQQQTPPVATLPLLMVQNNEASIMPVNSALETDLDVFDAFSLGDIVRVSGTENKGLRLRENAGLSRLTLFLAKEGERFKIIDGPVFADGHFWWQIQSVAQSYKKGWSVQEYLRVYQSEEPN